jgi:hypothetical protein
MLMKRRTHQEGISTLNIYAPNTREPTYIKQTNKQTKTQNYWPKEHR